MEVIAKSHLGLSVPLTLLQYFKPLLFKHSIINSAVLTPNPVIRRKLTHPAIHRESNLTQHTREGLLSG